MIFWGVATTFNGLTGSTLVHDQSSYSRTWNDVGGIFDTDGVFTPTTTDEGAEASSSESYAYTFAGNGFTERSAYTKYQTSRTQQRQFLGFTYPSVSFNNADNTAVPTSGETVTTVYNVRNVETTTTTEQGFGGYVLASTDDPYAIEWEWEQPFTTWTTVTTSNSETSGIDTETGEHTAYWFLSYEDAGVTSAKAVTTLEETETYAAVATVIEADHNEVIYSQANPGSVWNGCDAAAGSSATRITLTPSMSTLEGISNSSATGSPLTFTVTQTLGTSTLTTTLATPANGGTYSNNSLTTAITRTLLSSYTTSTTRISHFINWLPHTTISERTTLSRTQTSGFSFAVFNSGTGLFGGAISTTNATRIAYLPGNLSKYGPGYSYNSSIATSSISSPVVQPVSVFQSFSTVSANANGETTKKTINAGNTSLGAYRVGVANNGTNATSQFRWGTEGFVVGGSSGGWLSSPVSATILTAIHGEGRQGTTLLDFSNVSATVSSNLYSRRITTGPDTASDTTVTTGVISVTGGTRIKNDSRAYLHFGGGPFVSGWTVVEAAASGAYSDLINGGTTSFRGDDTSRAGGSDSAALSRYVPIPYYTPPTLGAGGPIYWTVQKNSTQLSPGVGLSVNTLSIVK